MKVGDYARTIYGQITKITYKWTRISTLRKPIITVQCEDDELYNYPNEIKTSPNIIDLIEVGDYVNGYRVIDFDYSVANTRIRIWIDTENEINYIFKDDIKSIVTKKQFSQMEYRIGE